MGKKKTHIIVSIIVSLLLFALMWGYYYLQINRFQVRSISKWLIKIYQKQFPIYTILNSKITQYILFTLVYVAVFHLINIICRSVRVKNALAVIMGFIFSLQIFITDTLMNFIRFDNDFYKYSQYSLQEFSISGIWNHAISRYGFLIIFIDFGFMCSLLLLMVLIKNIIAEHKHNSDGNDDVDINLNLSLPELIKNDDSAAKIVSLYINDYVGYKAVVDYIEQLEESVQGFKSLLYIEKTVSDIDPFIRKAVRKARLNTFGIVANGLNINEDDNPKVINVDFANEGKIIDSKQNVEESDDTDDQ